MLCLKLMRVVALDGQSVGVRNVTGGAQRSFSTRNLTRPSIFPTSALDQPCLKLAISSATSFVSATPILDLMPKISAHPALASMQIRCGPRDTYDPSHRIRKRRSGFLARKGSRTGRMILNRRRQKRRSTLSH